MIRSTINILRLVFTYFHNKLKKQTNKQIITVTLKTVTFLCKRIDGM